MAENTFIGGIPVVGGILRALASPFEPSPEAPKLQSPNALSAQPSQADAAKAADKKSLENEQRYASTSTVLTGGSGPLDQPSTTSQVLIGN